MLAWPVRYTTASAAAVARFAAARWALSAPLACTLLHRGFNDLYLLAAADGERAVLRISGHRARGPADVAAETAFLAYLDAAGVPVAAAMPLRGGALATAIPLPDGKRAAVLFRDAGGRRPELDAPGDAWLQGATLARIHLAAAGFDAREAGRYPLDLDHLLHGPVAAVRGLGLDASGRLAALAGRLAEIVRAADPVLTRTRCHGDCHGLNARIAEAGPHAGQAVFFDFDDSGFGYLAYDLAVHLWAQISFGRRRHAMWHAFRQGYAAIRPVATADEAAIAVFVAIRHVWLMGQYAGQAEMWGSEILSVAWLERELAFLLGWEHDMLGPRLL